MRMGNLSALYEIIYSQPFLIVVIQVVRFGQSSKPNSTLISKKLPRVITYSSSFHAFFSLQGMKNGLKPINAYQSQGPNFRQCWYRSYGTINIAANCTKNWSWTRKILYEKTVAHAKEHEICGCQTDQKFVCWSPHVTRSEKRICDLIVLGKLDLKHCMHGRIMPD